MGKPTKLLSTGGKTMLLLHPAASACTEMPRAGGAFQEMLLLPQQGSRSSAGSGALPCRWKISTSV